MIFQRGFGPTVYPLDPRMSFTKPLQLLNENKVRCSIVFSAVFSAENMCMMWVAWLVKALKHLLSNC